MESKYTLQIEIDRCVFGEKEDIFDKDIHDFCVAPDYFDVFACLLYFLCKTTMCMLG